jgi:hypothetical protein
MEFMKLKMFSFVHIFIAPWTNSLLWTNYWRMILDKQSRRRKQCSHTMIKHKREKEILFKWDKSMWPSHSKHFPRLVGNTDNMPATMCNSRPLSAILLSHAAIFRYMAATLPATHRLHNCNTTLPVNIARLNVPLVTAQAVLKRSERFWVVGCVNAFIGL